ncbi:hypothetical protein EGH10_21075 [Brevibacillus laterosporus]|uniref:Uncharacterized protein n=1 Tax=Brevibacillus laterosporus LMG 15441 TaxID=1042163 RepID=A0A075R807_BRELA|nr:hypothetical protein BRLA_c030760 [Brevibacillus laterosporus LMG 15441]RJL15323.1 hypothetical protein DM460_00035 [Brevibacillus laterosporus]TPH06512.1 hypothetical protein EGH10_21075 [Brevibacillus laterosporus]
MDHNMDVDCKALVESCHKVLKAHMALVLYTKVLFYTYNNGDDIQNANLDFLQIRTTACSSHRLQGHNNKPKQPLLNLI